MTMTLAMLIKITTTVAILLLNNEDKGRGPKETPQKVWSFAKPTSDPPARVGLFYEKKIDP